LAGSLGAGISVKGLEGAVVRFDNGAVDGYEVLLKLSVLTIVGDRVSVDNVVKQTTDASATDP
jgi:hypothetical protein